jgi:Holliday junction resolvasome RuvABC ATP-dependent DNA helicase subunit
MREESKKIATRASATPRAAVRLAKLLGHA